MHQLAIVVVAIASTTQPLFSVLHNTFTFYSKRAKFFVLFLQAQLHQCSSSIGSIKIRVGNEIVKRVFNFYKGDFKKEANQRICPCLSQLINMANSILLKQTSFYNLPGGLKFDYSLFSNPEVHGQFLNFELVGETVKADGAHDTPFVPGPLKVTVDFQNRMSVAFVSEYVFNSFSYQATKAGLFNEVHLEKNDHIKSLLRLKCAEGEQCIGRFAADMSKTFTDNTGIHPHFDCCQFGNPSAKGGVQICTSVHTHFCSATEFSCCRVIQVWTVIE
jgi:hypothetical protein